MANQIKSMSTLKEVLRIDIDANPFNKNNPLLEIPHDIAWWIFRGRVANAKKTLCRTHFNTFIDLIATEINPDRTHVVATFKALWLSYLFPVSNSV